ncbi:MAG: hypothetical protein SNG27_08760 [Rikenellaceae bacterium]
METTNNTQTYWQRIDALRKEITAEIIQTIIDHDLTEVEIYEEDGDNISVMWFGRHDSIHDTIVEKVRVAEDKLELVVEGSGWGGDTETLDSYDFALRNVSWLAEILDAVKEKLTPKTE